MDFILQWVKKIIILFLFLSTFLYMVPNQTYKKYIRFFMEMILVVTILVPIIEYVYQSKNISFDDTYHGIVQEMKRREQEAQEYAYLDEDYIIYGFGGEE